MATNMDFTPKKRKVKPITFTLGLEPGQDDGDTPYKYEFTPPKQAAMFMPVLDADGSETSALTAPFKWLAAGLSDEDMERIYDRLRDPEDDLDFTFMQTVVNGLTAEAGKRPTK